MKIKISLMLIVILCLASNVHAARYYISPSGNNAGAGDSGSPWKTFGFAIPKLNPGDTLILKDGTYTPGTTGMPRINCSAGAKNGTASAPITIMAENERKAWLKSDGADATLALIKCSYWNVIGLRGSSADRASGSGTFIGATDSDHIVFRRNLLHNSNRLVNQNMLQCYRSKNCLFEENELYEYTRHGVSMANTTNSVARRNYANSREYPSAGSVPGIPASGGAGGDSGVVIYPGSNNIVENNISERNLAGFSLQASGISTNNKFYGNISLGGGEWGGLRIRARGNSLEKMPQNTYFENQVVIGAAAPAGDFRANKGTRVVSTSILDSKSHGFWGNTSEFVGDGSPTMSIRDSLSVNNSRAGFISSNYSDFNVTNSNAFNNNPNFSPGSLSSGNTSVDPQMGSCKVFIPSYSSMKNAGKNGEDIGANVLCRYENGVLTQEQLWNWTTGQFPCGAIVPGVNDKAGDSCFDVHKRLNVNTNGCILPSNPSCYQPSGTPSVDGGDGSASPPCCV